ncbi:LPXTG-motif protein cell wall anchor domain protein [Gemella bergeri ATCC 700627]|uniref:LPXTG-motif protein cell wall anchor domain protein n=1 Tax=Gemella bergeri ATCC 700627 TaxID=1321820 RepID=U2QQM6_9BACL|nr:LPXTG cell wall anchor domain-containing protein [Gemella bergeri]ERK58806.1 LPXTG-motif protein cell wall anchor domain protein [Gemella bergeri ATCC 700627]
MELLSTSTLPQTGEIAKNYGIYIGIVIIILVIIFLIWRKIKDNNDENKQD